MKDHISGGYILLSRKLIESEIWDKPPLYLKVWIYLLSKAQHRQYKSLKRGQLYTSLKEIAEACSWQIGYRKETPNKDQIYKIIEWLRKPREGGNESNDESNGTATMIATTKATHGILINIENYGFYQDPKSYESNDEDNDENDTKATTKDLRKQQSSNNINKNDKNDKNIYYQLIADMYNKTCVSFPKITKLSDKRKKAIGARIKSGYTESDFKTLFEKAEASTFLKGGNKRNWSATFDWLIADGNMAKVLDGNYDSVKKTEPPVNKYVNYTQSGNYDMDDIERRIVEKMLKT